MLLSFRQMFFPGIRVTNNLLFLFPPLIFSYVNSAFYVLRWFDLIYLFVCMYFSPYFCKASCYQRWWGWRSSNPNFRRNKFGNLGVKLSKKQWIKSYAELTQQIVFTENANYMKKIESSSSSLSKNPEKKLKINSTFMRTSFLETKRSRVYSRLSESGIFPAIMTTFLLAIDPIAYDHCVRGISDNMNPNH